MADPLLTGGNRNHLLIDAARDLTEKERDVTAACMSPRNYAEVRKYGREILDIELSADLLKKGRMASLHETGLMFFILENIGDGEVLFYGTEITDETDGDSLGEPVARLTEKGLKTFWSV
jgi:hypothetical protein